MVELRADVSLQEGCPEPSRLLPARGRPSHRSPERRRADRDRWTAGPVRCGIHRDGWAAATRKPRLLFRLSGVFLLRFADRTLRGLLFQPPPRITRFVACDRSPASILPRRDEIASSKDPASG